MIGLADFLLLYVRFFGSASDNHEYPLGALAGQLNHGEREGKEQRF